MEKQKRIKDLKEQIGLVALSALYLIKDYSLSDEEIQAITKIADHLKESKVLLEKIEKGS